MVEIPLSNGTVFILDVTRELRDAARSLEYDHRLYFDVRTGEALPLDSLVLSHVRPDGVANAVRYMRQAATGEIPVRAPISARPLEDGRFEVVDGNSTATVAILAGWRTLWGLAD